MYILMLNKSCCFSGLSRYHINKKNTTMFLKYPSIMNTVYYTAGASNPPSTSSGGKGRGKVLVSFKPYTKPPVEAHDYKNMRLKRPMSPHITIYGPTVTALTSILQRISGLILSFYALIIAFGTLFLTNGVDTYASIIQSCNFSRLSVFVIKLVLGVPFMFHYFNALRFVAWTAKRYLSLKDIYHTAKISVICCGVATFLFALL